jgi:hypothetical protein
MNANVFDSVAYFIDFLSHFQHFWVIIVVDDGLQKGNF